LATWHVNNGSFCLTAWNESQWTVLLGYSTVSKMLAAIKHIAAKITIFFVHATQSSSAANFIGTAPNNPVLNPIGYKILRLVLQHEHKV